jgi:hypothetical protein
MPCVLSVGLLAEIAQLVEHATENRGVLSSILSLGTYIGHTQRYRDGHLAGLVQLVEHLLAKEKVVGSSPIARSLTQLPTAYRTGATA